MQRLTAGLQARRSVVSSPLVNPLVDRFASLAMTARSLVERRTGRLLRFARNAKAISNCERSEAILPENINLSANVIASEAKRPSKGDATEKDQVFRIRVKKKDRSSSGPFKSISEVATQLPRRPSAKPTLLAFASLTG